jgi:hypothetical protein
MSKQTVKALAGASASLIPFGWSIYKTCRTCGVSPLPPIAGMGIGMVVAFLWSD